MANIEQLISGWRTRLSARITNPSTLDELECHLREEMEKQKLAGLDEIAAFDAAAQSIGQPDALQLEFRKSGESALTADRIFGLLWFIYCAGSFYELTNALCNVSLPANHQIYYPDLHSNALLFAALALEVIYLRGLFASILLFDGKVRERRFIFFLAILVAIGGVVALAQSFHFLPCAFTIVSFITLIAYWPRRKTETVVQ